MFPFLSAQGITARWDWLRDYVANKGAKETADKLKSVLAIAAFLFAPLYIFFLPLGKWYTGKNLPCLFKQICDDLDGATRSEVQYLLRDKDYVPIEPASGRLMRGTFTISAVVWVLSIFLLQPIPFFILTAAMCAELLILAVFHSIAYVLLKK